MRHQEKEDEEETMKVKVRFFAQFGELLGTDIIVEPVSGTVLYGLIKDVARRNKDGYNAICDEKDAFREFVILMRNGKRVDTADAVTIKITDADEIAVFPPVAGG